MQSVCNQFSHVMNRTAHVSLSCVAGTANIGKKVVPVVLGLGSLVCAFDARAHLTGNYTAIHKSHDCKDPDVNMPILKGAFHMLSGNACDSDATLQKDITKLFKAMPFVSAGLGVAAWASFVLLDKIENGANYYASKLEKKKF